jgi:hypothetical protein
MFPKTIKIGQHKANYDLYYKTMSDALGRSVTDIIDSAGKSAHSETSYLLSIASGLGEHRPASDILHNCTIYTRHLFYSFLIVHTRSLVQDFNNFSNLDLTEFTTKNRLYLHLVSGRLRDFKQLMVSHHEVEDDFAEVIEQLRELFKKEGFHYLVREQKIEGVVRLL